VLHIASRQLEINRGDTIKFFNKIEIMIIR